MAAKPAAGSLGALAGPFVRRVIVTSDHFGGEAGCQAALGPLALPVDSDLIVTSDHMVL